MRATDARGLVGAFSSGLLLRAAGAVLNLLAVPIALRTLGQERYAAFAALLGLAAWLAIGNSGLSSATSISVGEIGDGDQRRELFWRAAISTVLMVGIVAALLFVPFMRLSAHLIPNASPGVGRELTLASYYCFAAFTVISVGQTFQGLYVGLLRAGYVNWCQLAGQLAGIAGLLTLPHLFPHMLTICIAVTFGTAAASFWFIIKGVLDCPPPFPLRYRFRESMPLFREGAGFLASSLSTLFYSGANLWIIALTFGTGQLATAAVMSRLIQMYFSVIALLLIPLAPALRNALAADDRAWVRKALWRTGLFMGGTGVATACAIVFLGGVIIPRWTGTDLPALSHWLRPAGLFVLVITWSYFWIYACFAVRGSLIAAILAVSEVAVVTVQFFALGHSLAPSSSLLIMAGSMMALSGIVLPVIVVQDLRRLRSSSFGELRSSRWRASVSG